MNHKYLYLVKFYKPQSGFTLVELVMIIVVLGVISGLFTVWMVISLGIGEEKNITRDAQLAQQRLELILAEKHNKGFPPYENVYNNTCYYLDPCSCNSSLNSSLPACREVSVEFESENGSTTCNNTCVNCTVTLTTNNTNQKFYLWLRNYYPE